MDPLSVENEMGMMLERSADHPYSKRETARKGRGPLGRLTDLFAKGGWGVRGCGVGEGDFGVVAGGGRAFGGIVITQACGLGGLGCVLGVLQVG